MSGKAPLRRTRSAFGIVAAALLLSGCSPELPFGLTRVANELAIIPRNCESLHAVKLEIRTPGPNGIADDADDELIWSASSHTPESLTPLKVLANLGPGWTVEGKLPSIRSYGGKMFLVVETDRKTRPNVAFSPDNLRAGFVSTWRNSWKKSDITIGKYSGCTSS